MRAPIHTIGLLTAFSAAALVSCGSPKSPTAARPAASAAPPSAAASAAPPTAEASPSFPMPPRAEMPERDVARSTRATLKSSAAPSVCGDRSSSKDPVAELSARVKGCGEKTASHVVGALFKASLDERGAPASTHVHFSATRCYRALVAASAEAESVVVVVRDSSGAKIAESPTGVLLADRVICAKVDDDAEVLISVGRGKGVVAVGWLAD